MALTKYSDFLSASKPTLITYCSVRGMSTSGNTKTELVAKAFTAITLSDFRLSLLHPPMQQCAFLTIVDNDPKRPQTAPTRTATHCQCKQTTEVIKSAP